MTKALQKKIELFFSLSIYFGVSFLMLLQTRLVFELFNYNLSPNKMLLSFTVGGLGVYLPMLILSFFILRSEGYDFFHIESWKNRMRFIKITKKDIAWCISGILSSLLITFGLAQLIKQYYGLIEFIPPFLDFPEIDRYSIFSLIAWVPFLAINTLGVEVLFRGVMQPRQENVIGKNTWIIQGIGLSVVYLAFGWQLLIIKLPAKFIIPFIVQKTQNSCTGIIIHAILNGAILLSIFFK